MKINTMGNAKLPPLSDREGAIKNERMSGHFASDLLKTQQSHAQDRLNSLLDEITAQGKRLGEVPTYAELKAYRELVRKFIGEAVGTMYSLQSQRGWDRHGRQKMYTIIKQIDQHLADLTEDVRLGQERQLNIMSKMDAIRGLLVDLYT